MTKQTKPAISFNLSGIRNVAVLAALLSFSTIQPASADSMRCGWVDEHGICCVTLGDCAWGIACSDGYVDGGSSGCMNV